MSSFPRSPEFIPELFRIIAGILVFIPRTAPLGIISTFLYTVNILLWVFLGAGAAIALGIADFLVCVYLIYAYSDFYKPMVKGSQSQLRTSGGHGTQETKQLSIVIGRRRYVL